MIRLLVFGEDLDRLIRRTEFACCHSFAADLPLPYSIRPCEVAGILIALSMLRRGLSRQLHYRQHCLLFFGKINDCHVCAPRHKPRFTSQTHQISLLTPAVLVPCCKRQVLLYVTNSLVAARATGCWSSAKPRQSIKAAMVAFSQTPRRLAQKIATTAYAANVRRCAPTFDRGAAGLAMANDKTPRSQFRCGLRRQCLLLSRHPLGTNAENAWPVLRLLPSEFQSDVVHRVMTQCE